MKKKTFALRLATLALLGSCICQTAHATNWFEIQNVALPDWGKGTLLGFIQPTYTNFDYTAASNHQIPRADLIGPTADGNTNVAIQRARLFLRGSLNPDISYYLSTEAGQNGYTYSFGNYAPRIIDANATFSHYIPGARIVVGTIRAPGPEGAMEGFMSFNFIDQFPTVIGQLMQPTFYTKNVNYGKPVNGGYSVTNNNMSGNNGFRYPGIEATDWFRVRPHVEVAYGAMLGDYGRQFETGVSNGPIVAARLQASYLFDNGKGRFFRNDLTGFIWYQQARPELNGISNKMVRDGFGATYRRGYMVAGGTSVKAEFINGTGNIDSPAAFSTGPGVLPPQYDSTVYPGSNNRAWGYDISGGVFVNHNVELLSRYDYYDRLPNLAPVERAFAETSLGAAYHINPLTKIEIDYIYRNVYIPNPTAIGKPGSPAYNLATSTVDGIGNEFNIYAMIAF